MSHQYAPVAPLNILHQLDEFKMLGHYQLLIAPIVLDHIEQYRDFFGDRSKRTDQLIIMDNGVIELGYPLEPIDLYKAAVITRASVIVLPDTIDDADYTVKQTRHAIEAFTHLRMPQLHRPVQLMGVVQGTTLEECISCATRQVEAGVDWLAVPRGLTPNLGSRVQLTVVLAEAFGLPIHVLGFSDNIADDIATATSHDLVWGIDAATPTWLRERLPLHPPSDPAISQAWGRRPANFWASWPQTQNVLGSNVGTVRRWLKDAGRARTERDLRVDPQGHSMQQ